MFFHLADKIYIVNQSSRAESMPDFLQASYVEYKVEKPLFPTFAHHVKDLLERFVQDRKVTLLIVPDDDFNIILNDWCHYLKLGEEGFNAVIRHSNFCEKYIEDVEKDISRPSDIKVKWEPGGNNTKVRCRKLFPAELCINLIEKEEWAAEKYEYFRMYDLYARIKDKQFELYLRGVTDEYTIGNDDQKIKRLYHDKKFIQQISELVDTDFLRLPLTEYIASRPTLGYNRFNIWKFNWLLADYAKESGYEY